MLIKKYLQNIKEPYQIIEVKGNHLIVDQGSEGLLNEIIFGYVNPLYAEAVLSWRNENHNGFTTIESSEEEIRS